MAKRRLPLDPNLEQLRKQAKDLLEKYVSGEPEASAEFEAFHLGEFHPEKPSWRMLSWCWLALMILRAGHV